MKELLGCEPTVGLLVFEESFGWRRLRNIVIKILKIRWTCLVVSLMLSILPLRGSSNSDVLKWHFIINLDSYYPYCNIPYPCRVIHSFLVLNIKVSMFTNFRYQVTKSYLYHSHSLSCHHVMDHYNNLFCLKCVGQWPEHEHINFWQLSQIMLSRDKNVVYHVVN